MTIVCVIRRRSVIRSIAWTGTLVVVGGRGVLCVLGGRGSVVLVVVVGRRRVGRSISAVVRSVELTRSRTTAVIRVVRGRSAVVVRTRTLAVVLAIGRRRTGTTIAATLRPIELTRGGALTSAGCRTVVSVVRRWGTVVWGWWGLVVILAIRGRRVVLSIVGRWVGATIAATVRPVELTRSRGVSYGISRGLHRIGRRLGCRRDTGELPVLVDASYRRK